jgi:hypothetical protein
MEFCSISYQIYYHVANNNTLYSYWMRNYTLLELPVCLSTSALNCNTVASTDEAVWMWEGGTAGTN